MNRGTRALVGTAVVAAVLAAGAGAFWVATAPVPNPLEDAAVAQALQHGTLFEAELTQEVEEHRGATRPDLITALDELMASSIVAGAYEPLDAGEADAAWRVQFTGGASWGGDVLGGNAVALLCVDVTVDHLRDPPVRMVDSGCPRDSPPYGEDAVDVDLPR